MKTEYSLVGFGGQELKARVYVGIGKLTVQTSRGDIQACSGDLILSGVGEDVIVIPPQTAHIIFGSDVMAMYEDKPEFLGLSKAQIADLSSPTHGDNIPTDIELARSAQLPQELPNVTSDPPPVAPVSSTSTEAGGANLTGGATPTPPVESDEARRIRESLEKLRATGH